MMKQQSSRKGSQRHSAAKRISALTALAVLTALMLTFCTACMGGGTGDIVTPDPNAGSTELQPIGIQNLPQISVNMPTAAAYVYYASDGSPVVLKAEDMELSVTAYRLEGEEEIALEPDQYSYEVDENGYIRLTCSVIDAVMRIKATSKTSMETADLKTAETTIRVAKRTLTVIDIIMLGIGIYALAMGILGKGRIYEENYVKEGLEGRYRTVVRISCLVVAVLMIGAGVIAAVDVYGEYTTLKTIIYIAAIVAIIAAYIVTGLLTDKKAKKEARDKAAAGNDLHAPDAAFRFDEDEPTIDDIKRL